MDGRQINDISATVEADRAHVRHHPFQHAALDSRDPRILGEGRGMTVWDQIGHASLDAVSGGV